MSIGFLKRKLAHFNAPQFQAIGLMLGASSATAVATGLAAVGTAAAVAGAATQMKGASDAKKAGQENAAMQQRQAAENARVQAIDAAKKHSSILARAGASGTSLGGASTLSVLNEQLTGAEQEQSWLKQAGSMAARRETLAGNQAATSLLGGAFGSLGQAASYWK